MIKESVQEVFVPLFVTGKQQSDFLRARGSSRALVFFVCLLQSNTVRVTAQQQDRKKSHRAVVYGWGKSLKSGAFFDENLV